MRPKGCAWGNGRFARGGTPRLRGSGRVRKRTGEPCVVRGLEGFVTETYARDALRIPPMMPERVREVEADCGDI